MTRPIEPPLRPRKRWPWILLLLTSLAWIGLAAGTAIGAAWLVPEGSGLAGPVIALGYGVLGAVSGLILGTLLGWRASFGFLRAAAIVAVVLALLLASLAGWRFVTVRADRLSEAGMDVPLPPAAGFRIESRIAPADDMRRYRELTIDGDAWTATWTAVGPEAQVCTARLIFDEADALLRKRAEVRATYELFASSCTVPEASATHFYALLESDADALSWEVAADAGCLQHSAEIAELHWMLGRIPIDAVSHGRVECRD